MAKKPLSVYGKWKFILAYFSDPCDAPFTAYVLTIGAASLETIVLLWGLDLESIFYTALRKHSGIQRPRSGRKGLKGSKGGRWNKRTGIGRFIPPDPNEIIGHNIGKASPLSGRPMLRGLGWLWIIYGILDFVGFVVFFASVITQNLFRWTSMLYNSRYCQARDDAVVLARDDFSVVTSLAPPTPLACHNIEKIRGPITYLPGTIGIIPSWSGLITASFGVESYLPDTATQVRVWITRNGNQVQGTEEVIDVPWGETRDFGAALTFGGGGVYQVMVSCEVGIARLTGLACYGQAQEPKKTPVAN